MDQEPINNESKEEPQLSKKERADIRRADKEKAQQKAQSSRRMKKYSIWFIVIAIIVGLLFWIIAIANKSEESRPGEHHVSEGREHINIVDHHDPYGTNPPTSGPHADPLRFGIYDTEIADENAIHNLEHGGIWISYKDITDEELDLLEGIARSAPQAVLLSPRSANDHPVSVASWQRLMHLEAVDVDLIEEYIKKNINRSPEPLAR